MSLQITVQVNDQITPDLRRLQAKLANLSPVNRLIGTALAALAKRAFDEPALRPAPWPVKTTGATATLRKTGMLWRSARMISADATGVTIGSDRPYAAIHQLGGQTRPHLIQPRRSGALFWPGAKHPVRSVAHPGSRLPARPFFTLKPTGGLTEAADQQIRQVIRVFLSAR